MTTDPRDLYLLHADALVRLATLLGAGDPEDVVADVFVQLISSRLSPRHERAYLNTAVVNKVRDERIRRSMIQRVTPSTFERHVPRDFTESVANNSHFGAVLAALSPRHREALVLRFWLDMSLQEMAAAMGVSLGTAKAHLSRALDAVRANDVRGNSNE